LSQLYVPIPITVVIWSVVYLTSWMIIINVLIVRENIKFRKIIVGLTVFSHSIFKLLRSPGIDSKESISPFETVFLNFSVARKSAGWYDDPIPTRFLAS
jgi:hypothetical protein